jgi:hypothetical protein
MHVYENMNGFWIHGPEVSGPEVTAVTARVIYRWIKFLALEVNRAFIQFMEVEISGFNNGFI